MTDLEKEKQEFKELHEKLQEEDCRIREISYEEPNFHKAWEKYKKLLDNSPIYKEFERKRIALNKKLTPETADKRGDVKNFGDLMTVQEFVETCRTGYICENDGSGYYSDGESYYMPALIRDFRNGNYSRNFSHVIWFNK